MRSFWTKRQLQRLGMIVLLVCFAQLTSGWAQTTAGAANPAPHSGRTVEDWSSLSLTGSELVPLQPILGEKDDMPSFTRELIRVQWRKGDPIEPLPEGRYPAFNFHG